MSNPETRLLRFREGPDGYEWEGVEREAYKSGQAAGREWRDIVRHVLVGKHAEGTRFHVRYFELSPGGYSSLEKHGHAHVVIVVRGRGRAVLGATVQDMRPLDTVYVAPWTPHQFLALGDEPCGFLCIVDAERDRPQPVSSQEHTRAGAVGASSPALWTTWPESE
jgi:quercetin dioxygenase-like cupin family protein